MRSKRAQRVSRAPSSTSSLRPVLQRAGVAGLALLVAALAVRFVPHSIPVWAPRETDFADALVTNRTCVSKWYNPWVPQCSPARCARSVRDGVVSADEARVLRSMAERAMARVAPPPIAGPSIVDIHAGFGRIGNRVHRNIYDGKNALFDASEMDLFRNVTERVQLQVKEIFGVSEVSFAAPMLFSRMRGEAYRKEGTDHMNDEYWHMHVDKIAYPDYEYTSLVYLTDHGVDFTGGRFEFRDGQASSFLEPKTGRLLVFSSGSENSHRVEKVETGTRYALTIAFTCKKDKGSAALLDTKRHLAELRKPARETK